MLANANIKTLEEEEDEEIDAQENIDLEANRKRRLQKHDKADTLTSEQMNQVWRTMKFCHSPPLLNLSSHPALLFNAQVRLKDDLADGV